MNKELKYMRYIYIIGFILLTSCQIVKKSKHIKTIDSSIVENTKINTIIHEKIDTTITTNPIVNNFDIDNSKLNKGDTIIEDNKDQTIKVFLNKKTNKLEIEDSIKSKDTYILINKTTEINIDDNKKIKVTTVIKDKNKEVKPDILTNIPLIIVGILLLFLVVYVLYRIIKSYINKIKL